VQAAAEPATVSAEPVRAREERIPVPFPDKVGHPRRDTEDGTDEDVLGLVAAVYDAHPDRCAVRRPDRNQPDATGLCEAHGASGFRRRKGKLRPRT
jgi:hypothetical protein